MVNKHLPKTNFNPAVILESVNQTPLVTIRIICQYYGYQNENVFVNKYLMIS
jgi:predicted GH43/DUF377 family glycosyl hydrolase